MSTRPLIALVLFVALGVAGSPSVWAHTTSEESPCQDAAATGHLDDPFGGASCAMASTAIHVGETSVDGRRVTAPAEASTKERGSFARSTHLEARSLAAHRGRAPPPSA